MITGGLIPLLFDMRILLEDKKRSMHAAETAYQAAYEYNRFLTNSGERAVDGISYSWKMEEKRVCVVYLSHARMENSVCIER